MSEGPLGTVTLRHFVREEWPWEVSHIGDDLVERGLVLCTTLDDALKVVARYGRLHEHVMFYPNEVST